MQQLFTLFVLSGLVLSLVASMPDPASASPSQSAQADASIQVEEALTQQFQEQGSAGYLIYFRSDADLSAAAKMAWNERGQYVMETLQKAAERSQARVKAYLDAQGIQYQSFWIDNIILVDSSSRQVFSGLTAFPEIQSLRARRTMSLIEPKIEQTPKDLFAIESNITHVNADDVWALGFEGTGVTIANVDTGVRYTHQAVNAQYRGNLGGGTYEHNYNWFDPYGDHPTAPADDNGHGTHTMGTMVGDDGSANQIGMAPSADWIACRACNTTNCTDAALLSCAQFIAAPTDLTGANPDPAKRPVAVNNSWGDCGTSYDNWYQGVVDSWHAAGIHPIFSNGNASNCGYSAPPGLNTVGNPARYGNVTGVGSSGTSNGQYASHSNWGPTDNPDTVNPSPNDPFGAALKPQVIAPGVFIRSSVNDSDSSYSFYTGTSMSAPHVTGLIALMVQAAPCLAGDYATVETILEETAVPVPYASGGSPAPPAGNAINYATGHGEIDALAAVNMALSMCGESTLSGQVTDSSTGLPLANVRVDVVDPGTNRHVNTDTNGAYSLNLFDGTYEVTFSKFGYISETFPGVVVATTATLNAALDPSPTYTISGVVTDATTGWPLYASIQISDYAGGTIYTDPQTGAYSVDLIAWDYTFTVNALSGGYTQASVPVTVTGNATQNIPLTVDSEACTAPGYVGSGFVQRFESWPPSGWAIVDNIAGGAGLDWNTNAAHGEGNYTGGSGMAAAVSSDNGKDIEYDTELRSPPLDPASLSSLTLTYKANYQDWSSFDAFDLDISNDGGANWENISHWTTNHGTLQDEGETVNVDLTPYVSGPFMLRWRYYSTETNPWDWYAEVDDVQVGAVNCDPIASGGLVIGYVIDANSGLPLSNADVVDGGGKHALFVDNSADASQPHPIYFLGEPAGPVSLTASAPSHGTSLQSPTVIAGGVVRQDFNLGTPPGVTSIVRAGSSPTNAASVDFTVTFSETVTGVDTGDFTPTPDGGLTGPSVTTVTPVSGSIYTVSVATGTGSGSLRLDIPASPSINDLDGNPLSGPYTSGESYTLDRTVPTVLSSSRVGVSPTNAASVTFTVIFSETVSGVDTGDFTPSMDGGVTGASVTTVTPVNGTTYTVAVNTGAGSGTLRLDVPAGVSIADAAGNGLGSLPYTGGQSYTLDKTAPTVTSITRADANPTSAASVNFTVTFSETVTGVGAADFNPSMGGNVSGATVATVTPVSGTIYTVAVNTGIGNGSLGLNVPITAAINDAVGNALGGLPYSGGESYTIDKGAVFDDVPESHWARDFIERLYNYGVTGGCGGSNYCPDGNITRAQMAVFILRAKYGDAYTPPAATGLVFDDVAQDSFAAAYIEALVDEGITAGCGGGDYCPNAYITRAEMAVFILRAMYGTGYTPNPASGAVFNDVGVNDFASAWIEALNAEGITGGCGGGNYCPGGYVTRAEMAVFLVAAFNIP
jgi:subtilisin family serine protease